MATKRYQVTATTELGVVHGDVKELTEEERKELEDFLKKDFAFFYIEDGDSKHFFKGRYAKDLILTLTELPL